MSPLPKLSLIHSDIILSLPFRQALNHAYFHSEVNPPTEPVDLPLPSGLEGQATDSSDSVVMYTQNAVNTEKKLFEMKQQEELKKRERVAAGGGLLGEIQIFKKPKIKEEQEQQAKPEGER
jgi:hypothetical protein